MGNFFKHLGSAAKNVGKKILNNPGRALELAANIGTAAGIREQISFSFNLSAPPGYKIIKEPNIILYKKINKTRLDIIQFFLEDNIHNPVDFNSETLTFTIQIIKI